MRYEPAPSMRKPESVSSRGLSTPCAALHRYCNKSARSKLDGSFGRARGTALGGIGVPQPRWISGLRVGRAADGKCRESWFRKIFGDRQCFPNSEELEGAEGRDSNH